MKRRSEGKRFSPHSDMLELLGFHSVFPASAGMIPDQDAHRGLRKSVPRKRGDDPDLDFDDRPEGKCSPQARG